MTRDTQALWYAGLRAAGIDYLRKLLEENPAKFIEVANQILDEANDADPKRQALIGRPVHFAVRQQPGSDNRT